MGTTSATQSWGDEPYVGEPYAAETYAGAPSPYHPPSRQMYPGDSFSLVQKQPASVRTQQQWMSASAEARLLAQPRTGPFSNLDTPVVSSLDAQQFHTNPLDTFQDNYLLYVAPYRNRNNNHDPRGQPTLPTNWNVGTDQLVQIRNTSRLDIHGNDDTGITGCKAPIAPKY